MKASNKIHKMWRGCMRTWKMRRFNRILDQRTKDQYDEYKVWEKIVTEEEQKKEMSKALNR